MQTTGFFKKALDPWHTVMHCKWEMDLMKQEVQPHSGTAPLVSPVHALELGISLRHSKLDSPKPGSCSFVTTLFQGTIPLPAFSTAFYG